ncbi:MAG: hypothetical protein K2X38_04390 [Gemmataceae bacterium]|nr:hypothetical protein [Gemmataceae bacterium]
MVDWRWPWYGAVVGGSARTPTAALQRPGLIEVFGIEVEYFHNYFVGRGPNAMLVHNGPGDCIPKPVLADHEAAGGHLIARHVGRTDAQLAARLAAERRISGASTFTDLAAADRGVAANEGAIRSWLAGSSSRTVVEHTLPGPVGRTLTRGATGATGATHGTPTVCFAVQSTPRRLPLAEGGAGSLCTNPKRQRGTTVASLTLRVGAGDRVCFAQRSLRNP